MANAKEHPESNIFRLLAESEYAKKLQKHGDDVKKIPAFQKELKILKKKYPIPKNDKEYLRYIDSVDKKTRTRGEKKVVYDKEWRDFCDRWDIEYHALRIFGKVCGKRSLAIGVRHESEQARPYLETVPGKISTEMDKREHLPLLQYIEGYHYGKPRRGRGNNTDRDKVIRAEYKKGTSIEKLAKRYNLSYERTQYIARSKKND